MRESDDAGSPDATPTEHTAARLHVQYRESKLHIDVDICTRIEHDHCMDELSDTAICHQRQWVIRFVDSA